MDEYTQNIIIDLILLIGCIWMLYGMRDLTKELKKTDENKKNDLKRVNLQNKHYMKIMDLVKKKKF